MIKAVLIDIDDTVLDFQKCAEWSIKTAMSERGVQYAAEMYPVFKEVNDRLWSELEKGNITRENIFDRRFSEIFDKLGLFLDGREFEARFIELLHESTEEVSEARALLEYLHGKRVLVVDDVISTGESLNALEELVRKAGGTIAGRAAVLAEGDAAQRDDILFLAPLPIFTEE